MKIATSLYLATKVNEFFGNEEGRMAIRIRDFLNVSFYACKEQKYFDELA